MKAEVFTSLAVNIGAERPESVTFSTENVAKRERSSWLREVIGREYANVEITPPADGNLFNEMTIYPWDGLRLSAIQSGALAIERLPWEPLSVHQDAYFAVVLLSGAYRLEQSGREVILEPGDLTLYDAAQPHRIDCPGRFSKLIVSIPRRILRERVAGIDSCTARRVRGKEGIGAVAANFITSVTLQAHRMGAGEFAALSEHSLDLLALAFASAHPADVALTSSRSVSLRRVKDFIERMLSDPTLDTEKVAAGTGLSARYINNLFNDEETSLMRYVWARRLEKCRRDILKTEHQGHLISEIAFRWGFNDLSHFSRAFKERFGACPRDFRRSV